MALISTALLSAGCVAPPQEAESLIDSGAADTEQVFEAPPMELSAEILYGLLTAELSYFRNDVPTSLEILEKLAFETSDPRIAELVSVRAINQRQFDVASNTTDLWVTLKPDSESAWFANAVSMVATQKFDQAVEGFQRMLELSTEPEQTAIQKIGRTLSSNVKPDQAYELFERIISAKPDSLIGRLQMIQLAINAEKSDALVEELIASGFEIEPDSDELAAVLFSFYLDRERRAEALAFADTFLARNPDSLQLRHAYARYLADEGLYQEAVKEYERIGDAESLFMLGNLHEQANFLELSRDKYLAFHEIQPDNQRVFISLAELALKQKQFDEASVWISRLTNRNFGFSRYLLTAKYVAGTHSVEEAVALLEEYPTENQHERIRVILVIEGLYREFGQIGQALSVIDSALAEFPNNTTLLIAKSYTAAELKLIGEVESAVGAILAQQPENALALNALGYTLIDQTDRLEEGTRYIEQALMLKPNDPYILDSMGWAHFKQGNYDSAIELLKTAISRRDDPVMAAHLGEVYWTLGRTQKAMQIWNQARKKSPDNEILVETIERLAGQ